MANNRLWLVCGDKKVLLAKYFPSGGWEVWHESKMQEFFCDVSFPDGEKELPRGLGGLPISPLGNYGVLPFRLELEEGEEE